MEQCLNPKLLSADLFFEPMHMMMSVLDPGFLGLMSYMLMKGSFAAHHGHQVPHFSVSLSLSLTHTHTHTECCLGDVTRSDLACL
jgi:hypothetical protein